MYPESFGGFSVHSVDAGAGSMGADAFAGGAFGGGAFGADDVVEPEGVAGTSSETGGEGTAGAASGTLVGGDWGVADGGGEAGAGTSVGGGCGADDVVGAGGASDGLSCCAAAVPDTSTASNADRERSPSFAFCMTPPWHRAYRCLARDAKTAAMPIAPHWP